MDELLSSKPFMAASSLLPPTASLTKNPSFPKHTSLNPFILPLKPPRHAAGRCSALIQDFLPENFPPLELDANSPLYPFARYGIAQLRGALAGLPEIERWEIVALVGLIWVYLTVRPGVLNGAVDAYVFAPLQLGIDSLLGRRNLKMDDFVVGDKLGEGSFGVVYYGALVAKNGGVEDGVRKRGRRADMDRKYKERVILKKASDLSSPFIYSVLFKHCTGCSLVLIQFNIK